MAIYRGPGGAGDATNDATSQSIIATQAAFEAAQSAAAAAASEVNAAASEVAASNSEDAAANSASSAASSATSAANALDEFTDLYLGAKLTDPTVDNDGNAIQTGALYFNTVANEFRVWTGTYWQVIVIGAIGDSVILQSYSGDGVETEFTLSTEPFSENVVLVFINGAYQQKNTYSISGTTLTFSEAPPLGTDNIEVSIITMADLSSLTAGIVNLEDTADYYESNTVEGALQEVGRKLSETVSVKDFGAVGDGVTDDTAAFQAAIDYLDSMGGGTVTFNARYLIDNNLTVKDYVTLEGPLGLPDEILPSTGAAYQDKNGVLIVNSAATITFRDSSSIGHCVVIRKGLTLPFADETAAVTGVAAFSGTALTVGGAGVYFHHLLILGFNKSIYSSGYERIRCEYVNFDCTNGIEILACTDITYIENCHGWPWTTSHQTWSTAALSVRTGTAYKFGSVGDWSKFTNCFSYGHNTGFVVDSCNNVNIIGCGTDYNSALSSTSVGYTISGTSKDTLLLGCQAAAQGTGVVINTSATTGKTIRVENCVFWGNDTYAIDVQNGNALIVGNNFRGAQEGINVDSTNGSITAVGNNFESVVTPLDIADPALRKSTIQSNSFNSCITLIGEELKFDNSQPRSYITVANAGTDGYDIISQHSDGTVASPTISTASSRTLRVRGRAYDGTGYFDVGQIVYQLEGSASAGSTPGRLVFSTTPSGSTTALGRLIIDASGSTRPALDNTYSCGTSSERWSVIYAATGTINTSDERVKTELLPLDSAEKACALEVKASISKFKFKDSVKQNGDNARIHFGVGAQTVKSIFEKHGLNAENYGLFCYDEWQEQQEVKDGEGNIVQEYREAGNRYGIRYDELLAFILGAI